jgi:glucuronosyltransferase
MDRAEMGVIYFSFGSLLDVSVFPKRYLDIFKNVLGQLEQKVIFKWSNNNTEGFPDNFYVDSWLPQLNILSNDRTLLD